MTARYRNPANGYIEEVASPGLWCLLFGSFYLAAKGVWSHAAISLALALITFGLSWFVYPFFARQIIETSYLRRGWEPIAGDVSLRPAEASLRGQSERRPAWLIAIALIVLIIGAIASMSPNKPSDKAPVATARPNTETSATVGESLASDDQQPQKPQTAPTKEMIAAATAGLTRARDAVEKIDFYSVGNLTKNPGSFWTLYIGIPDGGGAPYLNFRFQYAAENWLFIRSVTLSVDGSKLAGPQFGYSQIKRQAGAGMVWESYDETVQDSEVTFFERLAHSKNTIIRYQGDQFYRDQTLSGTDKATMLRILGAYAKLKH